MIFSEIYGVYYRTLAQILTAAVDHPLQKGEMRAMIERYAFAESALAIEPALQNGDWPLLYEDGTTPLRHAPSAPPTLLQRRWLQAIRLDPRIRLFEDGIAEDAEVEPLFFPEDVFVFDRYADGDPYEDAGYVERFRMILRAIREQCPLKMMIRTRRGDRARRAMLPKKLEYSPKDDKFRLIGAGERFGSVVNLARILSCERWEDAPESLRNAPLRMATQKSVTLEVVDRRNAPERVLLHFAHFEKEAERLEEGRYRVTIVYDEADETEIVIRILSFGPMVRVTAPDTMIDLIRERLLAQLRLRK